MDIGSFLILLGFLSVADAECPDGCLCYLDGYIMCSKLKSFPEVLPDDTTFLKVFDADNIDFPGNILQRYASLHTIEIFNGSFRNINSNAFSGLENISQINFYMTYIKEIEPYAFSDIRNISSFIVYQSKIDIIRQNAFNNIYETDHFEISYTNISQQEPFAFNGFWRISNFRIFSSRFERIQSESFFGFTDIGSFGFYKNYIELFQCQGVDRLFINAASIIFNSNTMTCNCGIAWILSNVNLKNFLYSNVCQNPSDRSIVDLLSLTSKDLNCTDVNDTCKQVGYPQVTSTLKTVTVNDSFTKMPITTTTVTVSSDKTLSSTSSLQHVTPPQSTMIDKNNSIYFHQTKSSTTTTEIILNTSSISLITNAGLTKTHSSNLNGADGQHRRSGYVFYFTTLRLVCCFLSIVVEITTTF